jgi:rhomboid protease GluP
MIAFLIRDFRRFPATMSICALWVAVYVSMVWWQGSIQPTGDPILQGATTAAVHAFGSITALEIRQGQWWRALTATCIHGGLLHIGMNILGFYRLGQMIEEWYGAAQLLFLYVVVGIGGSLIAIAAKLALHYHVQQPSVGGSIVLCGFMATIGLVGRRSGTKIGRLVASQVLGGFVGLGLLGALVPIIDNVGHAGGAIAGVIVSFFHRPLLRNARRPLARVMGAFAVVVFVVCFALQAQYARREAQQLAQAQRDKVTRERMLASDRVEATAAWEAAQRRRSALYQIKFAFLQISARQHYFSVGSNSVLVASPYWTIVRALDVLSKIDEPLRTGPERKAYNRVFELARDAQRGRPTPGRLLALETNVDRVVLECNRSITEATQRLAALGLQPTQVITPPATRTPARKK